MKHLISLNQAKEMTAHYRKEKEVILGAPYQGKDILAISESFDAAVFNTVLNQPGCKSLRIYYGMSDDLKVHAIIVGVNEKNEDMLPADGVNLADPPIIEEGLRCPPICPVASPLNS